jgi:hypothetical protein
MEREEVFLRGKEGETVERGVRGKEGRGKKKRL